MWLLEKAQLLGVLDSVPSKSLWLVERDDEVSVVFRGRVLADVQPPEQFLESVCHVHVVVLLEHGEGEALAESAGADVEEIQMTKYNAADHQTTLSPTYDAATTFHRRGLVPLLQPRPLFLLYERPIHRSLRQGSGHAAVNGCLDTQTIISRYCVFRKNSVSLHPQKRPRASVSTATHWLSADNARN